VRRGSIHRISTASDTHAALTMSDTSQRITSSLLRSKRKTAKLAIRGGRRLKQKSRASGENYGRVPQSFRAFFYSCLVAAVGAVEQHSKTTKDGMTPDPEKFLPPKF